MSMRILLTQRKLDDFAGTEMITLDLARSLKKRGHEVAVYCPRPGRISGLLAANSVQTYAQLNDIPWCPEVIHGHHQLPTIAALTAFEGIPALYACHGVRPWVERPPLHPQIRTYVAVSQKMAAYIATTYSIPEQIISIIPNFVDTDRFSSVRPKSTNTPRKAVLFGQKFKREEVQLLESACAQNSLALEKVGGVYGNPHSNPELFLPEYDVAFAIGRSAVEAMACGCATIPIMPHLAGQIVTHENFSEWAEKNFCPRFFTSADRISAAWLADQLEHYNPQNVGQVTEKVRREFALEEAVDQFESLYRRAVDQPNQVDARGALVAHLEKMALEVDENWETLQGVDAARAHQAALIKDQTTALREAQRQVRYLVDCVLSAPGGVLSNGEDNEWIRAIEANGLFDREWYLATNPDVAESGMDPLVHYINHGASENRDPSPTFDDNASDSQNPHLYEVGISLMQHTARQLLAMAHNSPQKKKRLWRAGSIDFIGTWAALLRRGAKTKR